ncbi:hypothetical protein FISHEDRAFT_51494 [Fistulina hepatica ATCC 64428]|uniref:Uncharacterized protein n=1 Tax=Fistulina hepatica ATCC 64428 TaxID=1128425 RepID=A0A0D7A0Z1_9AGAR|nr:hypothetical protein FISHEDRAFT_51494 [Fistulina hepatica ATCC 64428]
MLTTGSGVFAYLPTPYRYSSEAVSSSTHLVGPKLLPADGSLSSQPIQRRTKEDNEGKRRIRRKENAHFKGNPHIVIASSRDFNIDPPHVRTTFPEPLPPTVERSVLLPNTIIPARDITSANAGRFTLSLRGIRRELRKSGYAQELVHVVEAEIVQWLAGSSVITPDAAPQSSAPHPIGSTWISEISRSPLQLVWKISDQAFTRYIVHCCARYHEVISFSKDIAGERLTYLLRPNVYRSDYRSQAALETPPVTDIDYASQLSESDFVSRSDHDSTTSDTESDISDGQRHDVWSSVTASVIPEEKELEIATETPAGVRSTSYDPSDEADESASELGLTKSFNSVVLDPDQTLTTDTSRLSHGRSAFVQTWRQRHNRSDSSPSRSPARSMHAKGRRRRIRSGRDVQKVRSRSFYDYIYS